MPTDQPIHDILQTDLSHPIELPLRWRYTFNSITQVGTQVAVDGFITDPSGNTYDFPFTVPYNGGSTGDARATGLQMIEQQVGMIQSAQNQVTVLQSLVGTTINVGG